MKTYLAAVAALSLILAPVIVSAADAKADLQELIGKIQAKLKDGKNAEKDFEDELKKFDTLLDSHKSEKTDDAAQILFMKGMLYIEIFDNPDKGADIVKKVKTDYPESSQAKNADKILTMIAAQAESKKIQKDLAVGKPFPDFDVKDLDGKPLSVANFKGKIVLIDFWATWCGPCVAELPNVIETYGKYHDKGFEVIGISLDQDQAKLTAFIKEKKMPWPQYFDGKGWQNQLGQKYGINSIPATYLIGKDGNILAKNLRGEALASAVSKALEK
jgi:peroxiredoxin